MISSLHTTKHTQRVVLSVNRYASYVWYFKRTFCYKH